MAGFSLKSGLKLSEGILKRSVWISVRHSSWRVFLFSIPPVWYCRSHVLRSIAMTAGSLAPACSLTCTTSLTLCGYECLRRHQRWRGKGNERGRERLLQAPAQSHPALDRSVMQHWLCFSSCFSSFVLGEGVFQHLHLIWTMCLIRAGSNFDPLYLVQARGIPYRNEQLYHNLS